jgi:CBS-domain-containing membrane protein
VEDAARVMLRERVKRLPVIDEDGSLIGIVSRADLLGVYDRPDSDIREQVVNDVIRRSFLLEPGTGSASVAGGVVTVAGEVGSGPVARSIIEAVWHINGVLDVHDRLRWPGRRMGHQAQQARIPWS